MEKTIKKLRELARDIYEFAVEREFRSGWETLISNEKSNIETYFANNYETCIIRFGKTHFQTEIAFYSDSIQISFNLLSDKNLETHYSNHFELWNEFKEKYAKKSEYEKELEKLAKIRELETQLLKLKS